jgi:hypothetical protein
MSQLRSKSAPGEKGDQPFDETAPRPQSPDWQGDGQPSGNEGDGNRGDPAMTTVRALATITDHVAA